MSNPEGWIQHYITTDLVYLILKYEMGDWGVGGGFTNLFQRAETRPTLPRVLGGIESETSSDTSGSLPRYCLQ